MKRKLKRGWRWKKERSPTKVGSAVYVYTLFFLSSPSSLLIIIRCRPAWAPSFHQESLSGQYTVSNSRASDVADRHQWYAARAFCLRIPFRMKGVQLRYTDTHKHIPEKTEFQFFFLEGKHKFLYDTPIKEVDFKFYAQILWSKKLKAVISHEEGFLFLEGKSSLENRK